MLGIHSVVHLQNGKQLDVKVQRGSTRYDPPGTPVAIRQLARQHNLPPLPNLHRTERLIPPTYDLSFPDLELKRSAAIATAIEFLGCFESVKPASVMRLCSSDGCARIW